jgi:tetratricopeptide (TPR) repeat protein
MRALSPARGLLLAYASSRAFLTCARDPGGSAVLPGRAAPPQGAVRCDHVNPGDVVVGRFEIERLAGQGGMGAIYRARDLHGGARVALKVLRDTRRSYEDEQRFAREARVLSELSHPNIVRYVAHGSTPDGSHYLAMEWLEGEDLSQRLARTRSLTIRETVTLVGHAAQALSAAHARGILHRDLKPQNLFLPGADPASVKLVDFGIARFLVETRSLTRSRVFVGTPSYAAPEQVRDTREVDARADVFSLGCVLFECLAGRPPFVGEHVMAILAKVLFEEAPHVGALREGVPRALGDLIARSLAKDPAERPADASAVAAELAAITVEDEPPSPLALAQEQPPAPRLAPSTGERRLMTILLAAPADDGGAGETLTAETAIVPLEQLRSIIGPLAGHVERLQNGAVIATFPGKGTAADQVVRAARCALLMSAALPDLQVVLVTGRGKLDGPLPVGEVIDRAVGLMSSGGPSPIRIDDLTAGLLELRFTITGEPGARVLRGERDSEEGMRTLLGKPTPCVGRERELAMLRDLWAECVEEPLARVAIVIAEAGIGKSRLRYELVRSLRQADQAGLSVWLAQGDPIRTGLPYGLVAQLIRRAAELLDGDALEVRQAKLRARVGRHLSGEDAARVAGFLGELAGAPFPDGDSPLLRAARAEPALMGNQMKRAWGDFLAAESLAHPLLLVLEDLHWGDAPSVQMMEAALQQLRERPFMMLALARPEVRELFPRLVGSTGVQELRLEPLSRKASKRLGREVLGESAPEADVERIAEQSTGNALFLEELLRAAAEGKEGGGVPDTVLAMMQARLEALEPEARQLMLAASIFGEVFWEGGVAALVRGWFPVSRVGDWMMALVDREFLQGRTGGGSSDQQRFAFRHALMREAAYASLTGQERMLGHRLAAEWLEQGEENGTLVQAGSHGFIAQHFMRGEAWEKAAAWFQKAGDAAAKLHAFPEARAHYESALAGLSRLPAADAHRLGRLDAIMGYHAVAWLDEAGRILERLAEAESIAGTLRGSDAQLKMARVHLARGRALCTVGEMADCCDVMDRAVSIAEALPDDGVLGRALAVRAVAESSQGRLDASEASVVRAVAALERANDWTNWIMAVGLHATVLAMTGRYQEGIRRLAPLLPRAMELGSPHGVSLSHVYSLYTHLAGGDVAMMIQHGQATIEAAGRSEDLLLVWVGHWICAWAQTLLGEHEAAGRHAEQARALFEKLGGKVFISDWYLATEAARILRAGRPAEAVELLQKAIQRSRSIQGWFGEGLALRTWGQALVASTPRPWTEARSRFAESARLMERCGAKLEVARTHRVWGAVCKKAGEVDEARSHLERAAAILEACGNLQELDSVRGQLAAV